jgi:hypothetical protein
MKTTSLLKVPALCLLAFIITGFLSVECTQAKTVEAGDRIPLSQQKGNWETRDLTVNYQCSHTGNELKISGTMTFSSSVTGNFTALRMLQMQVLLIDDQGNLIGRHGLPVAPAQSLDTPLKFSSTIKLPPTATSFAFYYEGQLEGTGGEGERIWHDPIK